MSPSSNTFHLMANTQFLICLPTDKGSSKILPPLKLFLRVMFYKHKATKYIHKD